MIDPKRLDALLEELYTIEPELRAQDASLRRLAEELLASKPEAPVDESFVDRLRDELLARARVVSPKFSFMSLFSTNNKYLVPGFAVLALAVVGAVAFQGFKPGASTRLASAPAIERVGVNAFGSLAMSGQQNGEAEAGVPTRSQSGGGNGNVGSLSVRSSVAYDAGSSMIAPMPTSALPPMAGGDMVVGTSDVAVDGKMIAPEWIPTIYRYSYKGDAIENLASQVDVYRRMKGNPATGPLSALQSLNLGLIDLGKARDGFVQSFTISENRDQGYVFNVDPMEGMINVYQNSRWISPLSRCMDQNCYEQNRIKESDMLSDADAIAAADAFLNEYGIPKSEYGAPVINDQWRVQYAAMEAAARSSYWLPETVTVIYPTLIDGKTALDESGYPYGLNVNVDIRSKRAQSVWNLATRNYQVSSYAAETDAKRLIDIAENTDNYYGDMLPENAKMVDVELGTPTISYIRAWQQIGDQGAELLVPALVFPIKNAPADLWRKSVIVPLAKDLLDAQMPIGRPMPVDVGVMAEPPAAIKETK